MENIIIITPANFERDCATTGTHVVRVKSNTGILGKIKDENENGRTYKEVKNLVLDYEGLEVVGDETYHILKIFPELETLKIIRARANISIEIRTSSSIRNLEIYTNEAISIILHKTLEVAKLYAKNSQGNEYAFTIAADEQVFISPLLFAGGKGKLIQSYEKEPKALAYELVDDGENNDFVPTPEYV